MRRGRIDAVAMVLVATAAAAALSTVPPDEPATGPPLATTSVGRACPLTLPREREASLAFEKMMPVLMHPRCFNCHGGVNPFKPADEGGHLGGDLSPFTPGDCRDCHVDLRNLRNGRMFEWEVPPDPFHFVGKSSRDLCNQFKALEFNPDKFVGHMINENGGVQFTEAAYRGDRGLNAFGRTFYRGETGRDMVPESPPMPHSELVARAREWANIVGETGWKVPDCGCRLSGDAWEGSVSMVLTGRGEGVGTLTETVRATARFELDSSYIVAAPTDPAIYWKTTAGMLNWTVTMTGGECTASAGGSAPINLGADDNPWGMLRMEPADSGRIRYSVGIGPWPDAYEPRFVWRCSREPTIRPGFAYALSLWWSHPERAFVSADGKTIKGTYSDRHPLGTIQWVWDFKLVKR